VTSLERLAALLPDWSWPVLDAGSAADKEGVADKEGAAPDLSPVRLVGPFSTELDRLDPAGFDGPLRGLRLGVKENIALAGLPPRAGVPARDALPPAAADAPAVARLLAAGAHLVGACRMHELAFGVTGVNRSDGTPAHPLDPERIPGGSSSGSAVAVGLGLADIALATDSGGSARIPAALVGVVGYKASRALPVEGVVPLAPSLDHLGAFASDVATVARVAAALGLLDVSALAPARAGGLAGARLGVLAAARARCAPAVDAAVQAALDALDRAGAELVEITWPYLDLVVAVTSTIMFAEAAVSLGPGASAGASAGAAAGAPAGPDVADRLRLGASVAPDTLAAARSLGEILTGRWAELTAGLDTVLAPTTTITAPRFDEVDALGVAPALMRVTRLDNLTGRPAISLPIPVGDGLPVGLHVSGTTDAGLLRVAARVEAALRVP